MYIETERLIIRDFIPEDAGDLYEILGDKETMEYAEPEYSFEKTKSFLKSFCIEKCGAVAAFHKADNKVIGYILFNEYSEKVYEIGWFLNRKYWRKGYAFEACKAVIDYAFNELGVHKIFSETIDSEKSPGLMKKLGMEQEGILKSHTKDNSGNWKDVYLFGIIKC